MHAQEEFLRISAEHIAGSLAKINHALRQLREDQIWQRPGAESNSIGIILQHLTGNLNQWILAGIGGRKYERDRPAEFAVESRTGKDRLIESFNALIEDVLGVLRATPPDAVLSPRRIQGFDETVLSAVYKVAAHLDLHAGQILYIAKLMLGEHYQETWKPANVEQGGRK